MKKLITLISILIFILIQCSPAPRYYSRNNEAEVTPNNTSPKKNNVKQNTSAKESRPKPSRREPRVKEPVPMLNAAGGNTAIFTASYYGKKFHGQQTSNGETFDMYSYSAAHKKLPFGTVLKVTYLETGRSVLVKVNDRGPFIKNRDLDLSYGAAKRIGLARDGVGKVKVRVIKWGG